MPAALLALAVAAAAPDAAALLSEGDAAFSARGDPARLAAALEAYGKAAALDPGGPAELRLARSLAFRALSHPGAAADDWGAASRAAERALRRLAPAWAEAIDGGAGPEAATRVGAAGAEALYWLALASYSGAQLRGFAAILAVKDVALAAMERAAALDERLDHAGPHRALGAWRAALPQAAGGGVAASRAHFDRAVALAPAYQLTRVREAETLCVLLQDRKRFEVLLGEAAAFEPAAAPEVAPENRVARERARDLLRRADRLF